MDSFRGTCDIVQNTGDVNNPHLPLCEAVGSGHLAASYTSYATPPAPGPHGPTSRVLRPISCRTVMPQPESLRVRHIRPEVASLLHTAPCEGTHANCGVPVAAAGVRGCVYVAFCGIDLQGVVHGGHFNKRAPFEGAHPAQSATSILYCAHCGQYSPYLSNTSWHRGAPHVLQVDTATMCNVAPRGLTPLRLAWNSIYLIGVPLRYLIFFRRAIRDLPRCRERVGFSFPDNDLECAACH